MKLALIVFVVGLPLVPGCVAQPWRKPLPKWTDADARRVLSRSPWVKHAAVKHVAPQVNAPGMETGSPVSETRLLVRWESAFMIREALRRVGIVPAVTDADTYYAIAVVGLPIAADGRDSELDSRGPHASLQRDKKVLDPASVKILKQEDGIPMVVFFFPRLQDLPEPGVFRLPLGLRLKPKDFYFNARFGSSKIRKKFSPRDMLYLDKLDL